jgi:hypothetical protein
MDFLAKSAPITSSEAHPHHAQIVAKNAQNDMAKRLLIRYCVIDA